MSSLFGLPSLTALDRSSPTRIWESAGVKVPGTTHLPLYRLEDVFARSGFEISRATMSVWCRDVAELLKPLYDRMVQRVLSSHLICSSLTSLRSRRSAPCSTRQAA